MPARTRQRVRTKERGERDAAHRSCNVARVPTRGSPGTRSSRGSTPRGGRARRYRGVALLLDNTALLKEVSEREAWLSCRIRVLGLAREDKEGVVEDAADKQLEVEVCAR